MAAISGIELFGDKQILANMEKLSKKDFTSATRKGSKIVLQETKSRIPVLTGVLLQNTKVRSIPRSRTMAGTRTVMEFKGATGRKGGFYGHWVNYGTRYLQAREFIQQGAKAAEQQAFAATKQELIQMVEKEWK